MKSDETKNQNVLTYISPTEHVLQQINVVRTSGGLYDRHYVTCTLTLPVCGASVFLHSSRSSSHSLRHLPLPPLFNLDALSPFVSVLSSFTHIFSKLASCSLTNQLSPSRVWSGGLLHRSFSVGLLHFQSLNTVLCVSQKSSHPTDSLEDGKSLLGPSSRVLF